MLVNVITCAVLVVPTVTLPKPRLVGENETLVPTPVMETVCGLPGALYVTVKLPVCVPVPTGLMEPLIVQFAPAPNVAEHRLLTR